MPGRKTWLERKAASEAEFLSGARQPYVVIVGGGQAGITLAARLKRLGVPALVVEKNARPGDSWRRRYNSLVLHDPVWYDHLPYLPFPEHWPVFSPKDKMGDWLEMYTGVMEFDYWSSSECQSATYDEQAGSRNVRVNRGGGRTIDLHPKHLVLATGVSGFPNLPALQGAKSFQGTIVHSSEFAGGGASQMIIDRRIKLKSPVGIERLNEHSVTLTDETELPADLVVCATGYGSMNEWAAKLISQEVADRVGKCWGLGSRTKYDPGPWVGELRNMWKPTQQPGLWFHGGNLMQARHYSLYLALQLKARMEGIPTPVYFLDPVHHLS